MKVFVALVAAILLATTLPAPERKVLRNAEGTAVWIPEKDAISATGFREDAFPANQLNYLRDLAKTNRTHPSADDCYAYSSARVDHFKNTRTFDDLVESATQIVRGRVSTGTQGFLNGRPGTIFPIHDCEFLKGTPQPGDVLLFYPEARIASPEGDLCARALNRASAPALGTVVTAFDMVGPFRVADVTILFVNVEAELVHVGRDGRVYAPASVKRAVPKIDNDLTELKARISTITNQRRTEPR